MWDLSSPTKDRTRIPCIGRLILNHWTVKEVHYAEFCDNHSLYLFIVLPPVNVYLNSILLILSCFLYWHTMCHFYILGFYFAHFYIFMFYFILFFKNYLFIYFWLCWVFIAVRGLSLVAANGGYSSLWCTGFSLRWLLLLWSTGSRRVGFSSCGLWALQRRLSSCGAWA